MTLAPEETVEELQDRVDGINRRIRDKFEPIEVLRMLVWKRAEIMERTGNEIKPGFVLACYRGIYDKWPPKSIKVDELEPLEAHELIERNQTLTWLLKRAQEAEKQAAQKDMLSQLIAGQ